MLHANDKAGHGNQIRLVKSVDSPDTNVQSTKSKLERNSSECPSTSSRSGQFEEPRTDRTFRVCSFMGFVRYLFLNQFRTAGGAAAAAAGLSLDSN